MTSQYIHVIEEQLEAKYPQHEEQETLKLENIRFKLFLPKTTLMLTEYQNLRTLFINHCDLRNLDNFPKLYTLEQLDLGYNQIQGTFNNLMPLKRLKYLNVEHNLIFQSNKLAPLRKIAACHNNSQEKNQPKICVCIRDNPFIQQNIPYLIKFKSYGLKVIKQPKEYFDKKKQAQQNMTTPKTSAKKGKKIQPSQSKSHKKRKMNWFQQSSNEDSSVPSHESSIVQQNNNQSNLANNPNSISNNLDQHDRRPSILDDEPIPLLRVSRRNILDNYGGDSRRLMVRLNSNCDERPQMQNMVDDPFLDFSLMDDQGDEEQFSNLREIFVLEDDDNDSDSDGEDDRFCSMNQSSNSPNNEVVIQQRLRLIGRRNARLEERQEERQEAERQLRLQRERVRRYQERQRRFLRQRQIRLDYERRREERELLRREEAREQQRQLMRRLSSSSGGNRNPFRNLNIDQNGDLNGSISSSGDGDWRVGRSRTRMTHQNETNNLGNRFGADSNLNLNSSINQPVSNSLRRQLGSRDSFNRRFLQRSQNNSSGVNDIMSISENLSRSNNLHNSGLGISSLPPLRIRASDNIISNFAIRQRTSSIANNPGRISFDSSEGNNLNQRMRVINSGNMDSDSDQDQNNNQESLSDSNDHDDHDEDDDEDEDDDDEEEMQACDDEAEQEDEQEENQNLQMVQPQMGRNQNNRRDQSDSGGIELFINVINNPNVFGAIDHDSNDDQFDFIIDENGISEMRRQRNNNQSNLSLQPGNIQSQSGMRHENEDSSSSN